MGREPERPDAAAPAGHRALEVLATLAFTGYAALLTLRLAGASAGGDGLLVIGAGLLLGYLAADLLSGLAHWVGDRFFDEATPFIGRSFIAPFREHHVEPEAMVEHDLVELVGNTAILALPPLACAYHGLEVGSGAALERFLAAFTLSSLAGAVLTNLFHRWAHMARPPLVARGLQRLGIVIDPARHARHHRDPFDRAYCITTGWLNAPMDRLGIWAGLERLLGR
jgi:ubiquitin-conjugating enzyme E2 variant